MIRKAMGHLISCKEVSRLVSLQEDLQLPPWQRWRLRLHLSICVACARFESQIRFLRTAMRSYRA
jgi:hypothetical protein